MMLAIDTYREEFIRFLSHKVETREPQNLYEPITYILELGGKRLRPILTLMTADMFTENYDEALHAALAVEMFHNFSLVHDDIMDDAPLRRGNVTVHEKWDVNTGILSGDAMLILAYQLFEQYEAPIFKKLAALFTKTALEVCEGQQYDIDFETRNDVTEGEYLKMIEYKTAVLVGAAMQMGAIVAETSEENANSVYEFGRLLGIAFQLQDDYLDAFGNPETFGKQVGGDIIENKKTYLYIKAMAHGTSEDKEQLYKMFNNQLEVTNGAKVDQAKAIFDRSGAVTLIQNAIADYTEKAFQVLEAINVSQEKKAILVEFGNYLMKRTV